MDVGFSVFFKSMPLEKPYNLSFGTIKTFDSFFIVARSLESDNQISFGEITPLPGYNHENVNSVKKTIRLVFDRIRSGTSFVETLLHYQETAPFAVSGIVVSLESLINYSDFSALTLKKAIPLTSLCDANSLESLALHSEELTSQGFHTLKMKVGKYEIEDEIKRVKCVAGTMQACGSIRLDANQCYNFKQALQLCKGLEDTSQVSLLEQPFKPDQWLETERLIQETSLPIMLDESIWTVSDVIKAADIGAKYVKFKLCKHFGISGSLNLIQRARSYNLNVIYGNGVQTAIGNHCEAQIHQHTNLQTASEGNGFLKVRDSHFRGGLSMKGGELYDCGFSANWFTEDPFERIMPEQQVSIHDNDLSFFEF